MRNHAALAAVMGMAATFGLSRGMPPTANLVDENSTWEDAFPKLKTKTNHIKSGERYEKAEAKRQRKAAKRLEQKGGE